MGGFASSRILEVHGERMIKRTFAPGFRIGLHQKDLNLALQGGGSHGAFTWGVLDRLLDDASLPISGISGTSAGALNAAVLACGWVAGGRAGAQVAIVFSSNGAFNCWKIVAARRASSSGASTSSNTQIGAGLAKNTPKINASAVSVCSPPDKSDSVDRRFPGG